MRLQRSVKDLLRTTPAAALTAMLAIAASTFPDKLSAQAFQIVWVNVGEAATQEGDRGPRAGRRLFDVSDLAELSLGNVTVVRVDVAPVVTEMPVGAEWCLTSLEMQAFGPDGVVDAAPLSITVRQDQRQSLRLKRSRKDICVQPAEPGEYPVRLTSLLPAPDGTMRGAQIFLRVHAQESPPQTAAD